MTELSFDTRLVSDPGSVIDDGIPERLLREASCLKEDMVDFLRRMIAIPSESRGEERLVRCIEDEMRRCGFDEVKVDGFGNILGRIGSGSRVIAMDAHIDTVGVGDRSAWKHDPYEGAYVDGVIYGRGASDQEAGMAAMVHAARLIRGLGLEGDYQLWITGTVQEEDCDGLCWQYILREGVLSPEVVVITEPTGLKVYRGHRGRMEIRVRTRGLSCHASAPERGDNAIYKMAPVVEQIESLNERLAEDADPFLGKGTVAVTWIASGSPSLCAVADECTIHLDRRLTLGEDMDKALEQVRSLEAVKKAEAEVFVLEYSEPSYTGLVYPTTKYYPTWCLPEEHPVVEVASAVAGAVLGRRPEVGKWTFSTNGVATCGMFGIPTVGFGPADECYAHGPEDQCPAGHLVHAAAFYALFPSVYVSSTEASRAKE